MKKIFFVTVVLVLVFTSSNANINKPGDRTDKESRKQIRKEKREERRSLWLHSIDPVTEAQFYMDFPDVKDASWTEGVFAEAVFMEEGVLKTAYYDESHTLVGTTADVDFSILPVKARQYISKQYKGYKIEKVILFDDNESNNTDMFLFNSAFEDEDNYFPVLSKDSKQIILKVSMNGNVSFFQNYK
jgi:hypothetical protein